MARPARPVARSPQDRLKAIAAQLDLTAEQQSQATAIFANAQASESAARAGLKTEQEGLNDAVKSNNSVAIEQHSSAIAALRGQLTLSHSKTRAALYQILTSEQRAKMDQLEKQHWHGAMRGPRVPTQ